MAGATLFGHSQSSAAAHCLSMVTAFGRHRDSGVAASLTGKAHEGEAIPLGFRSGITA